MPGSIGSTKPIAREGPIVEAACWAHARRKFFDLARINQAPIASEAVGRIDALFALEREINGLAPPQRVGMRTERSRPFVAACLELQHAAKRSSPLKRNQHFGIMSPRQLPIYGPTKKLPRERKSVTIKSMSGSYLAGS